MSQSEAEAVVLDDREVCRMMADTAVHNKLFKQELLFCAIPHVLPRDNTKAYSNKYPLVASAIKEYRELLVAKADLEVPTNSDGGQQDIGTYLRKPILSRQLERKANTSTEDVSSMGSNDEWGWVGSPTSIVRLAVTYLQSALRFQADPTPFPFERLPPELRLQVYRKALIGNIGRVVVTRVRQNWRDYFQYGGLPRREIKDITTGLLATNRLINREAISVLYQLRSFNFATKVGGVVPFLSTLSEEARRNLHGIGMTLHDRSETDHCCPHARWGRGPDNQAAWCKAGLFIADHTNIKILSLTINVKVPEEFKSLKWVKALILIRQLKSLRLVAIQHEKDFTVIRARYGESSVTATDPCYSEYLVPLFEYMCEEMLGRGPSGEMDGYGNEYSS